MTSLVHFTIVLVLLITEGWLLASVILSGQNRLLCIALSLPISALVNVLIVFVCTVFSVPLVLLTMLVAHAVVIAIAAYLWKNLPRHPHPELTDKKERNRSWRNTSVLCACMIIACTGIYSLAHSIVLPTFQYDSATNWTMRSQISFYDHAIAFDTDENRGMAKPQYPVLFHALQLTANLGQRSWNDTMANTILELLSISSFAAVFLLIRRMKNSTQALVTVALIVGIPMVGVHLAQGYGDINLLQYLLLSLTCFAIYADRSKKHMHQSWRWLVLSTIFIVACVWTKPEGWFFGLVPWLMLLANHAWRHAEQRKNAIVVAITAIALWIPWYLLLWAKGLGLTPHSSDTLFAFHPEGVREVLHGLFDRGSFGILWYALPVAMALIVLLGKKKHALIDRSHIPLLFWGSLVFLEVLFIYLFTPNVAFLLNAQSFYRQMMIPGAILVLGCSMCIERKEDH